MIIKQSAIGNGISASNKPNISFDGKWSGWHIEFYNGVPYWEALFSSSGTLTNFGAEVVADAWGIGGGGAGGKWYQSGTNYGCGGGSGYLAEVDAIAIAAQSTTAITIGAGAVTTSPGADSNVDEIGAAGGTTSYGTLSAPGGKGGNRGNAAGGSRGGDGYITGNGAGENGTPGDGKIMSKFFSAEHNKEYGAKGVTNITGRVGGGGGGYLDVGAPDSNSGHGFGAGGSGTQTYYDAIDFKGKSGCLILRIKAA